MKVTTTVSFNKEISKIRDKQLLKKILNVIAAMERANNLSDIPHIKKLQGGENAYRIRIGNYRLGFYFINNTIQLSIFADRKDIYKSFP